MAPRTRRNQPLSNSENVIGTSQTADNTLANAPDTSMIDPAIDTYNQSGDDHRRASEEPNHFESRVEDLENEFRAFRSEFRDFRMENASNNIQSDLDDMHRAHILMNETLTSRMDKMDAFDKELSSQLSELKELIQNNLANPSLVPGRSERDQAIAEELLFAHQMGSRQRIYSPFHRASENKGKAPERIYSPPPPPSPMYHQPFASTSRMDPVTLPSRVPSPRKLPENQPLNETRAPRIGLLAPQATDESTSEYNHRLDSDAEYIWMPDNDQGLSEAELNYK